MTALPFRAATAKIPADQAKRGDGASGDNTVTADDTFEHPEEHDYSLLRSHAHSNTILKTGAAALLTGLGVGAAAFGISYAIQPKVIETTKVVTETKIERIEIPKIVEKEVIKTVEIPKIIDRPVAAPQPSPAPKPAPQVGDRTTDDDFKNSEEFQSAAFKGKIVSIRNGDITFSNGRTLSLAGGNGELLHSPTTNALNGRLAYCAQNGAFGNGRLKWPCQTLKNGVVVSLMDELNAATASQRYGQRKSTPEASNPFEELFR
jgi:hypothetical protein